MFPDPDSVVKEVSLECSVSYRTTRDWVFQAANFVETHVPKWINDVRVMTKLAQLQERNNPLRDVNFIARQERSQGS